MATAKRKPTVHIVNPKDPSDPAPWIANVDDVALKGWTLWADRHDPKLAADVEKAAEVEVEKVESDEKGPEAPKDNKTDDKPAEVKDGSAVDPKDVKKAPGK